MKAVINNKSVRA